MKVGDRVRTLRDERSGLYSKGATGTIESDLRDGVWVVQFDGGQHAVAERWLEICPVNLPPATKYFFDEVQRRSAAAMKKLDELEAAERHASDGTN